jgi:molybdopterin-guanine dinucleotide biosynthesis protein A
MTIPLADITGLVLAGGRGSRMGGVDKGLQTHRGLPLVQHALQRLRPQVGGVLVSALRGNTLAARYYAATLRGRLEGFLTPGAAQGLPLPALAEA